MSADSQNGCRVIALCGGVGGAKLAFGLARRLGQDLAVVVNTGDDFEHLGLTICPDIDTVLYTLGGLASRAQGWGRADESWNFMQALAQLGGETWFQLGDRDLALHVRRTSALAAGATLTRFTADTARRLEISSRILPMSDGRVRTVVETSEGVLAFQRYFVERRCAPVVKSIFFDGADKARPPDDVVLQFESSRLEAIVICPSNPYLSIDPILAVTGMRRLVQSAAVPVVAVSPIIQGRAVKGPTTKIMEELGIAGTSSAIVSHYRGLIDGLVVDSGDLEEARRIATPVRAVPTLMSSDEDRERLAGDVLEFVASLAARRAERKAISS
jgi:LPPG:FO 2-phospho-L-lactate transferase